MTVTKKQLRRAMVPVHQSFVQRLVAYWKSAIVELSDMAKGAPMAGAFLFGCVDAWQAVVPIPEKMHLCDWCVLVALLGVLVALLGGIAFYAIRELTSPIDREDF